MGIKAHFLKDNNGNKFYPYAHANAVFDSNGQKVEKRLNDLDTNKIDKQDGKSLSSNDYTDEEKNKLASIQSNAEQNVQSDWNEIDSTSDAYIKNKPTSLPSNGGNSDTVNGHTVNSDVPANAKFTDTVYDDTEIKNSITELNSNLNESISSHTGNTSNPHSVTKAQVGLGNVENKSSATIRGEITKSNVTTALGYTPLNQSLKGSASGLAELDSNGKVPSSQLPSFVDDVVEGYLSGGKFYKESAHTTEISGETGKIYIDLSTEKTYRWSGSAFVVISETLALGETSSTAYRGDRGKTAYDHSQSTHARTDATKVEKSSINGNIKINGTETTVYTHPSGTNPHGTTKSDVGLGNVGNFKAVSTVASQGLSDTEKSNARANIGAGTSSFSGSYNDLTNKPTIPTVGNGTVTIKQAGTSKGTFTMNQSGNTTIELTDNNTTYGVATQSANGLESAADKKKLDGIATGAEVNQNAYSKISVVGDGAIVLSADEKESSVEFDSGTGINIGFGSNSHSIMFTNTGVTNVNEGAKNGTINVTLNGKTAVVPVKGLGSAAYTNSGDYLSKSGGTVKGTLTIDKSGTSSNTPILSLGNSSNKVMTYIYLKSDHPQVAGGWEAAYLYEGGKSLADKYQTKVHEVIATSEPSSQLTNDYWLCDY